MKLLCHMRWFVVRGRYSCRYLDVSPSNIWGLINDCGHQTKLSYCVPCSCAILNFIVKVNTERILIYLENRELRINVNSKEAMSLVGDPVAFILFSTSRSKWREIKDEILRLKCDKKWCWNELKLIYLLKGFPCVWKGEKNVPVVLSFCSTSDLSHACFRGLLWFIYWPLLTGAFVRWITWLSHGIYLEKKKKIRHVPCRLHFLPVGLVRREPSEGTCWHLG